MFPQAAVVALGVRVDLGGSADVSSVNVRNYVDGMRFYTYRVLGGVDGTNYFVLGGKSTAKPAVDHFGAVTNTCYIRIVGLSNSANPALDRAEVTVRGPAG
jgi:alpha-N-acetylglucosaminidase